MRDVEPARIERWVTENTITSEEALAEATEEAIGFAESLGFAMDNAEFVKLSAFERDQRMHRWNKLRKLRKLYPDVKIKLFYERDFERLVSHYGLRKAS